MNQADLMLHDQLSLWLSKRFGLEGTAMLGHGEAGLDRLRPIFESLKVKLSKVRIITIAGTNGKGETAYRLEQMLLKKNYTTALWTSPHLVSVCERMRFNGLDVEAKKCLEVFNAVYEQASSLSYYEFLFYSFLSLAAEELPDVLLLEVGLGGRLDAVNLLEAEISLICSIGRDHQAILGNTLDKILIEKLGVTRAGKICLSALDSEFLRTKAKEYCHNKNTKYWDCFSTNHLDQDDHYVRRNQVLARAAFMAFERGFDSLEKFDSKAIKSDNLSFPGRREVMTLGTLSFIFIGAHNIDGFRQAVKYWCSEGHPDEVWVSFSNRPRKDLNICTGLLRRLPKKVKKIFTFFEHPRALDVETLQELAGQSQGSIEFAKDWKQLIKSIEDQSDCKIAVSGSYYFIGSLMRYLLERGAVRQRNI